MIRYLTTVILFLSLVACEKEHLGDCFNSTGNKKVQFRNVPAFTKIELDDRIDLNLIWDTTESAVQVEAGSGIIDNIITEVKNDELKIYNTNRCNWVRSFKKKITVTIRGSLWNTITYRGSGTIRSKNQLKVDQLNLDCWEASGDIYLNIDCKESYLKSHTGPTTIYVEGNSNYSYLFLSGNGLIKAENLAAVDTYIINKNQGDAYINTSLNLDAFIEGNGNIFEFGSPVSVDVTKSGSGNLIRR